MKTNICSAYHTSMILYILRQHAFLVFVLLVFFSPCRSQEVRNATTAELTADSTIQMIPQSGHYSSIQNVSISHDNLYIASASTDGTVKLFDLKTQLLIHTFREFGGAVECVAFSPNGRFLAGGDSKGEIIIWNILNFQIVKRMNRKDGKIVGPIAYSSNGRFLYAGGWKSIAVWSVEKEKIVHILGGHSGGLKSIAFTADGNTMVSLSSYFLNEPTGEAIIWDTKNFSPKKVIPEVGFFLAINPDGKSVMIAGSAMSIWNIQSGENLLRISTRSRRVECVVFAPDGKMVASVSGDGNAKFFETNNYTKIDSIEGAARDPNFALFSPDGNLFVTTFHDSIILWDVKTRQKISTISGLTREVTTVALSGDGQMIYGGFKDGSIRALSLRSGKIASIIKKHDAAVISMAVSGNLIASADDAGNLRINDLRNGATIDSTKGYSVAFSPDGKTLASGYMMHIRIWDSENQMEKYKVKGDWRYMGRINTVSIDHNGNNVACDQAEGMNLWDLKNGKDLGNIIKSSFGATSEDNETIKGLPIVKGNFVNSILFSPAENILATGSSDGCINLWEVPDGKRIRRMCDGSGDVNVLNFSSDGSLLASGGRDGIVRLWDMKAGILIHTMTGHIGSVTALNFSTDRTILASTAKDDQTILWEPSTANRIATLVMVKDNEFILFTPDGYYLSTKAATQSIGFKHGTNIFPFEQFDLLFNRPDIVLSRIGKAPRELILAYSEAYKKRLRKMNFTETMLKKDFHLPEIIIASEEFPLSTNESRISFNIKALDSKYYLDRINIQVNGVPIYGVKGINLRAKKLKVWEQEIFIELSAGPNKIQVSVLNEEGVESLRKTFKILYNTNFSKPNLFLAAVGVSKYRNSKYDLVYAAKDAKDFVEIMKSDTSAFNHIYLKSIIDTQATINNIMKIHKFFMSSKVDDQVILFAAGHGLFDSKFDYYFGTSDVDFSNPSIRGLPYVSLESLLDGVPARQKLLLVDACNSGELDKEEIYRSPIAAKMNTINSEFGAVTGRGFKSIGGRSSSLGLKNSFDLMLELFADLRRGSGAAVISSASGIQFSLESDQWRNGVFTYAILEGFRSRKADLNMNGEITVSEIKEFVTARVDKLTAGKQTPTMRKESLEFDWRVY